MEAEPFEGWRQMLAHLLVQFGYAKLLRDHRRWST